MGLKTALVVALLLMSASDSAATTYYVSKNGTGGDGRSWATSWTTISQVNSGVSSGDTVFFGTGLWTGTRLKCVSGTPSDRTVYACSSFATTNGDGEYHFAKIWASNPVTTSWTSVGNDIWRTTAPAGFANAMAMGHPGVGYKYQATIAGDEQYNVSGGYLYVRIGLGQNPNDYNIQVSTQPLIYAHGGAGDATLNYVTLWGLDLAFGYPRLIDIWSTVTNFRVEHCKLVGAHSTGFNNPALWYSGNTGASVGTNNAIVACSLGYAFHDGGGGHGCGVSVYSQSDMVVDSCTFFGKFDGVPLIWKNDTEYRNDRNVVKNCLFTPSSGTYGGAGLWLFRNQYSDSVYNNVFAGSLAGGVRIGNHTTRSNINTVIYNNTFINCAGYGGDRNCIDGDPGDCNTTFKYNIIYRTNTPFMVMGECLSSTDVTIDSNMYVVGSANAEYGYANYVSQSYWINTLGHDRRSAFLASLSSIGFADYARGDYSRNPDTTEMNLVYGGRQWLYYGANLSPIELDTIPPSPIEDLGAVPGASDGEIVLSWTASGNDGDEGTLYRCEVMWSETPITNVNWSADAIIYSPKPAGSQETYVIRGLEPGYEYFAAVRGYDFARNETGISNIAVSCARGVRSPPWLFTSVNEFGQTAELTCSTVVTCMEADVYRFALTDSLSGSTVTQSVAFTGEPTLSVSFADLNPSLSYYWRCRAVVTGTDSSAWSFPKKFRLDNVCPDPPYAVSPANLDTISASGDGFTLIVDGGTDDDSTGALSYDFELYKLGVSVPVATVSDLPDDDPLTSWAVPVSLDGRTTYRWRARSYDGLDYSFWSDWFQFTLVESSAGGNTTPPGTIIAYPNPVHFRDGEYVTFKLPDDPVDLLIQTVSGETVLLRTGISGDWQWFGENGAGNIVATGIYSWFVRGTNQNGKIVVKP